MGSKSTRYEEDPDYDDPPKDSKETAWLRRISLISLILLSILLAVVIATVVTAAILLTKDGNVLTFLLTFTLIHISERPWDSN